MKTGIISIIGPPNVGKSTLLNQLLGQKISIVSPKPQTTRNRITGVVNDGDSQMVFLDTPGIHKANNPLNREMVKNALRSLTGVDLIILMIDINFPYPEKLHNALHELKKSSKPVLLLINKIDLIDKNRLLPIIKIYADFFPFQTLLPISAKTSEGIGKIKNEIIPFLPEAPPLFPENIPTDLNERFIASEIIREKIFLLTHQEVPYSTAVIIESFQEEKGNPVNIHATIYLEKKSQKGIIIGKNGRMLKKIGISAREDMEKMLGTRVVLDLRVKLKKEWRRNQGFLRELQITD
ncbi:MAG: GTPase Era [Thermodesulfobacteriota bacterium]